MVRGVSEGWCWSIRKRRDTINVIDSLSLCIEHFDSIVDDSDVTLSLMVSKNYVQFYFVTDRLISVEWNPSCWWHFICFLLQHELTDDSLVITRYITFYPNQSICDELKLHIIFILHHYAFVTRNPGEHRFPSRRDSNAENASKAWRYQAEYSGAPSTDQPGDKQ